MDLLTGAELFIASTQAEMIVGCQYFCLPVSSLTPHPGADRAGVRPASLHWFKWLDSQKQDGQELAFIWKSLSISFLFMFKTAHREARRPTVLQTIVLNQTTHDHDTDEKVRFNIQSTDKRLILSLRADSIQPAFSGCWQFDLHIKMIYFQHRQSSSVAQVFGSVMERIFY